MQVKLDFFCKVYPAARERKLHFLGSLGMDSISFLKKILKVRKNSSFLITHLLSAIRSLMGCVLRASAVLH